MSTQTPTMPEKIVSMVTHTNAVVKEANAIVRQQEKTAAAVDAAIPACVKALIDNDRIDPREADKFAAALRDPVQAIQLMTKMAATRNAVEARLGVAVEGDGQKRAGAVAQKKPPRPEDVALWTALGLPAPSGD